MKIGGKNDQEILFVSLTYINFHYAFKKNIESLFIHWELIMCSKVLK